MGLDTESDDEMNGKKEDSGSVSNGGSPSRSQSPSSSVGDAPESPGSADENAPVSPEQEPQSPTNERKSPLNSDSDNEPDSPEPPPHSPVGSVAEDGSPKGETVNQNENSEDEEVVREDAESEDDARESDREDERCQSPSGDIEMVDDNAGRSPASDDVENSNQGSQGDDDDNASVEERASIHSDDEEETNANDQGEGTSGNDEANQKKSPSENDKPKKSGDDSDADSEVEELIADIFGDSDEEEEFEGFGEEDLAKAKQKSEQKKKVKALSDSDEENEENGDAGREEEKEEGQPGDKMVENTEKQDDQKDSSDDDDDLGQSKNIEVYDFDIMLQKKREEASTRRRRRGDDIINDSDDLIADILQQMTQAADEDRALNKNRLAATKKLKLLPMVASQLKKADLKISFLEQGVLSVMTEWLTPLPDKSLPHLQIREILIKLLDEFPPIDQSLLKSSGIGRSIMYLYKHPKETKENRIKAGRLISEWSRPIFNLKTDFLSISKEEREKRDFEHAPKKLKLRLESGEENAQDINTALTGDEKSLRPGEKGWIGRARVPMPSTRDYVVRPKWNVEAEFSKASKKQLTRLDRHMRNFKEKKKQGKIQRAVTISIEGRKMSL